MKTKAELEKIISDAQAELDELNKPFELDSDGYLVSLLSQNQTEALGRELRLMASARGLIRKTKSESESASREIIKFARLLALRDKLDDGGKRICRLHRDGAIGYHFWTADSHPCGVLFSTDSAERALELLNSGRFVL